MLASTTSLVLLGLFIFASLYTIALTVLKNVSLIQSKTDSIQSIFFAFMSILRFAEHFVVFQSLKICVIKETWLFFIE